MSTTTVLDRTQEVHSLDTLRHLSCRLLPLLLPPAWSISFHIVRGFLGLVELAVGQRVLGSLKISLNMLLLRLRGVLGFQGSSGWPVARYRQAAGALRGGGGIQGAVEGAGGGGGRKWGEGTSGLMCQGWTLLSAIWSFLGCAVLLSGCRVWGVDVSPGGGEEHLKSVHHLREEHQGLGVVLHRVRHALSRSCHLLPEELDVFGAVLHGAGRQLHRRPQLV